MKEKLLDELEKERDRFISRNQETTEHDVAIDYLKYGILPKYPDNYELLDAILNDFETTCRDYGVYN